MHVTESARAPRTHPDGHNVANRQARRVVEELAQEAGRQFAESQDRDERDSSRTFIVDELIPRATAAGIRFATLAELLGINLRTLRKWRLTSEQEALDRADVTPPAC